MTWTRRLGLAVAALYWASAGHTEEVNLRFDGVRPLSAAVDELSTRLGYVITYEDPRYTYAGDLQDATAATAPADGPKVFWPIDTTLEVRNLQLPKSRSIDSAVAVLARVLDVQAHSATGGRYRILQTGEVLHVVPASVRDQSGAWIEQRSVLDVRISIPFAPRTRDDMISAICKAVSLASGINVIPADPYAGALGEPSLQGAHREMAREVLIRALGTAPRATTWKLHYLPNPAWRGYFLSTTTAHSSLPKPDRIRPRLEPTSGTPTPNPATARHR